MWRGQEDVWLTPDQLERRASARRQYNAWRQFLATYRRCEVVKLLGQGWKRSHIVVRLGVSPSTICREIQPVKIPGEVQERSPGYRSLTVSGANAGTDTSRR